jgi:hypothetical protein
MNINHMAERDFDFFNAVKKLITDSFPEMAERYGIWKVHQHFELKEDEVFHETSCEATRESTLKIIKRDELPNGAFASTWKIEDNQFVVANWCCDDIHRPKN